MLDSNLEDVIRRYVRLPPHPNSKGWFAVLCKVCNDHGRKGNRAAFQFDGGITRYHCFNCGHVATYDPLSNKKMPRKMIKVLDSFGVPDDEWKQVVLTALSKRNKGQKRENGEKSIYTNIEPTVLEVPDHFYPLGPSDSDDKWTLIARDYLEQERGVDPDSYSFYLSSQTESDGDWKGRLIIPIYKDSKLIFYQGRSLTKNRRKYLNPDVPKDNILYGFDRLFEHTTSPLYVVEGWFDAFAIGGVGLLGNEISEAQISWLNRSQRPKIIIPDRFGNGHWLAEKAVSLGWKVSFPDTGNCKDVSEAVKQYGKLYVLKSIADNTKEGFDATLAIGVYCKRGQDKSKNKSQAAHKKKRPARRF